MRKVILCLVILGVITTSAFANVISEIQKVQAPISNPITLPSTYSEKGFVADIISKIFNNSGQIENEYTLGLANIDGRYQDTIPKWNGQSFIESDLLYSAGRLTVRSDIDIQGDIYKNGTLYDIPTPPNCSASNSALGWDGSNWVCNTLSTPPVSQGSWSTGSWGSCSAPCGGGTQSRSVSCSSSAGCSGSRPSSTRACNTGACAAPQGSWSTGIWGSCSSACGGGVQSRSVSCSSPSGCSGSRPSSTRSCNTGSCSLPQGSWNTGAWSSCSASCGGGTQSRSVSCSSSAGCSGSRPSSSRSCNNHACSLPTGPWSTGGWSSCSVSCGSGVQTRNVSCSYAGGCTGARPSSSRLCNTQACPLPTGPFSVGSWSSCSANPTWSGWGACTGPHSWSHPGCFSGNRTRTCLNSTGTQTRSISCNYAGGCIGSIPPRSRSCSGSCTGISSVSCRETQHCR